MRHTRTLYDLFNALTITLFCVSHRWRIFYVVLSRHVRGERQPEAHASAVGTCSQDQTGELRFNGEQFQHDHIDHICT